MYFGLLRMQIQEEMRLRVSIWPRSRLLARFESIVRVQWRSRSVIQYRGWIFSYCRTMNFRKSYTSSADRRLVASSCMNIIQWKPLQDLSDEAYILAVGESSLKFCLSLPGCNFIFSWAFSSGMKDMMRKGVQSINTVQFQADL